jgi:hypothetical protein
MLQDRSWVVQPEDPAIRFIGLTKGQVAIVDEDDYERMMQWSWYACWQEGVQSFYAQRSARIDGRKTSHLMHREIMQPGEGLDVDHRYSITLDNRKSQLRVATTAQSLHNSRHRINNTSGFKGVSFAKDRAKFRAFIKWEGRSLALGAFDTAEEAHDVYMRKATELYGEFARAA